MTTVKLDSEDDEILEKLRAKMILRGKKMTKKEILGKLIKQASTQEEFYDADVLNQSFPLEEDPFWVILQKPDKLELTDTSTKIDDYVYT
ncbi:MAG: hypothetical protein ACW967_04345 [Candidatus Hodarchaeales archaeon]|jgi:hypothetical protein